jgi:hypothetical protein
MIRVERGQVPEFVHEPGFLEARARYEEFRSGGGSRTSQTYLDFQTALGEYQRTVSDYVHLLFHGKCAYTEVVVAPQLHLHRPDADAYDDRLPSAPNHYWWTALWYRNWYNAAGEIVSLKRTIFPVIGERAPEPKPEQITGDDGPGRFLDRGLLLDPCEDHPQLHLLFQVDGQVVPWAEQSAPWLDADNARRGPETIRLLDLNNRALVESRRAAAVTLLNFTDPDAEVLGPLLDPALPHLGASRQISAARLLDHAGDAMTDAMRLVAPELVPYILASPGRFGDAFVTDVRAALAPDSPGLAELLATPASELRGAEPESLPSGPPPEEPAPTGRVIPRTAAITRVVIRNFQAIDSYQLDVPTGVETVTTLDPVLAVSKTAPPPTNPAVGSSSRPWRVFLGENGSGKSSALRAVALAVAGDEVDALVELCGLEWRDLLRRGTTDGSIRLELTGGDAIELAFTADGPTAESQANLPHVDQFVRGFGATRLTTDPASGPADNVRLGNLFDPLQPVVDAQRWLVALEKREDKGDFNVAALTIAKLLGREEQVAETGDAAAAKLITREGEEIWVGGEPLRTLSDGYRAIISLACDLMAGAGSGLSDMRNATGIVLIDELGCYLHPRWKMQITRTLRKEFPSMQFFVTTHEPLCLRGLVEREVVRVTRSSEELGEEWHAVFETIEESPSKYRVDRLLTSEFFGLDTTIDPDVEQEFQQYYALVRRTDLSGDEDLLRSQLRARLSQHGILGYTARDQLVYDAIDAFLATSSTLEPEARKRERRTTLDNVADIWRGVAAKRAAVDRP